MVPTEIDRSLLAGFLAVHHGLLDRAALLSCCRDRVVDQSESLGALLAARGELDTASFSSMEELAGACLARGLDPSGPLGSALVAFLEDLVPMTVEKYGTSASTVDCCTPRGVCIRSWSPARTCRTLPRFCESTTPWPPSSWLRTCSSSAR